MPDHRRSRKNITWCKNIIVAKIVARFVPQIVVATSPVVPGGAGWAVLCMACWAAWVELKHAFLQPSIFEHLFCGFLLYRLTHDYENGTFLMHPAQHATLEVDSAGLKKQHFQHLSHDLLVYKLTISPPSGRIYTGCSPGPGSRLRQNWIFMELRAQAQAQGALPFPQVKAELNNYSITGPNT